MKKKLFNSWYLFLVLGPILANNEINVMCNILSQAQTK